MDVVSQEAVRENHLLTHDQYPLLTGDNTNNNASSDHVIHIHRGSDTDASSLQCHLSSNEHGQVTPSVQASSDPLNSSPPQPLEEHILTPSGSNSQVVPPTTPRRNTNEAELGGRRHWSPLDSGFWLSIELVFTLTQITASVIVMLISRHEKPRAPLSTWVLGHTIGCVATLPIIYWRYVYRNCHTNANANANHGNTDQLQENPIPNQTSYINLSSEQSIEQDNHHHHHHVNNQSPRSTTNNGQTNRVPNPRLSLLVDHIKMALDCFFAVWFVLGNVWIFGGRSSASDAPNLYRLCVVYLTLSCIGYAMPFILCAMICCCLPCIISMLGIREEHTQVHGASEDSINALPAHKFHLKRNEIQTNADDEAEEGSDVGGVIAIGTDKERDISGEDAVCCVCLARYVDDDDLRELPCSHFFHAECVDRWLRINATCPLCKFEVGDRNVDLHPPQQTSQHP